MMDEADCPNCGALVFKEDKRCPECGYRVDWYVFGFDDEPDEAADAMKKLEDRA